MLLVHKMLLCITLGWDNGMTIYYFSFLRLWVLAYQDNSAFFKKRPEIDPPLMARCLRPVLGASWKVGVLWASWKGELLGASRKVGRSLTCWGLSCGRSNLTCSSEPESWMVSSSIRSFNTWKTENIFKKCLKLKMSGRGKVKGI